MTAEQRIRVFIVDDHALLREGIAAVINNERDMVVVAQAAAGRERFSVTASIART